MNGINNLSNFLIVGAMKAGTSSFSSHLSQHPEIFMAPKELHYFNSEGNYTKGPEYYRGKFSSQVSFKAIGEKTPSYSYHPKAAQRIHELLPNVKLIWLFRDPVYRAYSHYNFFVQRGMEKSSFKKALIREKAGQNNRHVMNYLDRSVYIKQVNHYLRFFTLRQMLFVKYEDYIQDPQKELSRTCQFLGVTGDFQFVAQIRKNATRMPKNRSLQFYLKNLKKRGFRKILKILIKLNTNRSPGYPNLDSSIRNELKTYFVPFNMKLQKITGLDLLDWNK